MIIPSYRVETEAHRNNFSKLAGLGNTKAGTGTHVVRPEPRAVFCSRVALRQEQLTATGNPVPGEDLLSGRQR